mmetsp:Transcript_50951/g.114442  ORF Transcript_50951/g.114442 Transcript_50951/m.114442 type:complete len:566 (+) Transcript_50951:42-1739(+)
MPSWHATLHRRLGLRRLRRSLFLALLLGLGVAWTAPGSLLGRAEHQESGQHELVGRLEKSYDLAGLTPRYYQREAVRLFLSSAQRIREEKGRPMRFQLVGGAGKTAIYAMIAQSALRQNPTGRVVIFVPWRALAEQTSEKLTQCGLRTCVLGDGMQHVDMTASVVVCVYNSARRLAGQSFMVKVIDEAHHVEGDGLFTHIMRNHVRAQLEGDFSATFRAQEVDYSYSFEKAVQDGYVCDLRSFTVPLLAATVQEEHIQLAKLIQQKQNDWAPMLILFNRMQHARAFSARLNSLDVSADVISHRDSKQDRRVRREALEENRLKALCTVRIFNEGMDIPSLRAVVLATPRPHSDTGVQQALMRTLRPHPNKPDNSARFVQVVNPGMNASDFHIGKSMRRSLYQVSHLWMQMGSELGWKDFVANQSTGRLRLMDAAGRTAAAADDELWAMLAAQGRPRQSQQHVRRWIWRLLAWFRYFGEKPRNAQGRITSLQKAEVLDEGLLRHLEQEQSYAAQWRRLYSLINAGKVTAFEHEIMEDFGLPAESPLHGDLPKLEEVSEPQLSGSSSL